MDLNLFSRLYILFYAKLGFSTSIVMGETGAKLVIVWFSSINKSLPLSFASSSIQTSRKKMRSHCPEHPIYIYMVPGLLLIPSLALMLVWSPQCIHTIAKCHLATPVCLSTLLSFYVICIELLSTIVFSHCLVLCCITFYVKLLHERLHNTIGFLSHPQYVLVNNLLNQILSGNESHGEVLLSRSWRFISKVFCFTGLNYMCVLYFSVYR